jgi:hypothetical protein
MTSCTFYTHGKPFECVSYNFDRSSLCKGASMPSSHIPPHTHPPTHTHSPTTNPTSPTHPPTHPPNLMPSHTRCWTHRTCNVQMGCVPCTTAAFERRRSVLQVHDWSGLSHVRRLCSPRHARVCTWGAYAHTDMVKVRRFLCSMRTAVCDSLVMR